MHLRAVLNCILAGALILSLSSCYTFPDAPDLSDPAISVPDSLSSQPSESPPVLGFYPHLALHPILSSDRLNSVLTPLLYQGLFELDPFFVPRPVLCESYTVSEDGLTWSLTLKQGVSFSDGTPLTPQAVITSLELARNSPRYAARFSCITAISADSSDRLVLTLSHPNTGLPALLDIPIVSADVSSPAGTGPYVLEDAGQALILRRDIPSLPAKIALLPLSGPVDLSAGFDTEGTLTLTDTDPTATDATGFSGTFSGRDYDTTTLIYLGFHTGRSTLGSSADRAALSACLDRDTIVLAAFSGHALASTLPIHPASPLYDETLARQLRSNQSPQDLLARAGLTGKHITLLVNSENSAKVTAARLIARQLEKAGMTVSLSILEWSRYLAALNAGQFDLYLGEVDLTADFDLSCLVGSSGSANYTRCFSPQIDRLVRSFLSAPEADRPQAARDLCVSLSELCPIAPLCFKRGSILTRPGFSSEMTPTRANAFYGWF